jgi:hypothetical protein
LDDPAIIRLGIPGAALDIRITVPKGVQAFTAALRLMPLMHIGVTSPVRLDAHGKSGVSGFVPDDRITVLVSAEAGQAHEGKDDTKNRLSEALEQSLLPVYLAANIICGVPTGHRSCLPPPVFRKAETRS